MIDIWIKHQLITRHMKALMIDFYLICNIQYFQTVLHFSYKFICSRIKRSITLLENLRNCRQYCILLFGKIWLGSYWSCPTCRKQGWLTNTKV